MGGVRADAVGSYASSLCESETASVTPTETRGLRPQAPHLKCSRIALCGETEDLADSKHAFLRVELAGSGGALTEVGQLGLAPK
jgi:hypothetical protein